MPNANSRLFFMMIVPFGTLISPAFAQIAPPTEVTRKLASPDWQTRREGLYALLGTVETGDDLHQNPGPAAIALQKKGGHIPLLKLLDVENTFQVEVQKEFARTGKPAPNGYHDYFPNLLRAVCALREPRAIPLLLPSLGSGNMVSDALASYGDESVPWLFQRLDEGDGHTADTGFADSQRGMIYQSLSLMVERYSTITSEANQKNITARLLKFAAEKDPLSKTMALEGLARIGGTEAAGAIRSFLETTSFDAANPNDIRLRRTASDSLERIEGRVARGRQR